MSMGPTSHEAAEQLYKIASAAEERDPDLLRILAEVAERRRRATQARDDARLHRHFLLDSVAYWCGKIVGAIETAQKEGRTPPIRASRDVVLGLIVDLIKYVEKCDRELNKPDNAAMHDDVEFDNMFE